MRISMRDDDHWTAHDPFERLFGRTIDDILNDRLFLPFFANVREDVSGYYLEMSVPGFTRRNLSIRIEEDLIVVEGKRTVRKESWGKRLEFEADAFQRTFILPEHADIDRATAECRHGLLLIYIPRREARPEFSEYHAGALRAPRYSLWQRLQKWWWKIRQYFRRVRIRK